MKFSCIIPAYNEAPRIANVLQTALACDLLDEVIVVNDGSTDDTWQIIDSHHHPKLKKIHLEKNLGKTRAFFSALRDTIGTHIVMIDADYSGFRTDHITKLVEPVVSGHVDVTMMMWYESLRICKLLKHDIFSGTRVLPRGVFDDEIYFLGGKGFGLESRLNEVMYAKKLTIRSLYFPEVHNPHKGSKHLIVQFFQIAASIPLWKIARQSWYIYKQQP